MKPQYPRLRFGHECLYDLNCPLELGLLLVSGLNRAFATAASLRPAVLPHEIIAAKRERGIESVDVLGSRRRLGRNLLKDRTQLQDERGGVCVLRGDGLGCEILQRGRAVGANRGGDVEQVLGGQTGDGHDLARTRGCEATGDA